VIDWQPISTAPTEDPGSDRDRYLVASFPKGIVVAVTHLGGIENDSFTSADGEFHPPTHWAEINDPEDSADATDWVAEAKSWEQTFVETKDEYSELARAIGIRGDTWFGDPLEPHHEVVERAKAVMALLKDAELALQPIARFAETYPDADADQGILTIQDARCPVSIRDMQVALGSLNAIRTITKHSTA
jgi:hypothetical protein